MTVISTVNDKKEDMKQKNNDTTKNNNNTDSNKNNQDGSSNQKVKVHLVAVGSAPILKKNKFLMNRSDNFGVVISFLVKRLRLVTNASGSNTNNTGGSNSASGSSSNNGVGSNDSNNNNVNNNNNNNNNASSSSLFVYVNSAFVPSPTENIGDLYDCFGMKNNGELILHYSLQEAWG
jgi:ubiquitin-like protein ATG12